MLARVPDVRAAVAGDVPAGPEERRRPSGLETRPGVIEIDLADGSRVRVDGFVDGRALARVLGALKPIFDSGFC